MNKHQISVRNIFLMDGVGALLSVILLGIVLVKLEWLFGIPGDMLIILASVPVVFFLYDCFCFFSADKSQALKLRIIACANILYCVLSVLLLLAHHNVVTIFGWIYIVGEILIVLVLARIELIGSMELQPKF